MAKGEEIMSHDIPEAFLDKIVRRLVEGLRPEQIILFGSYAYGEPTQASDLDLMIIISESTEPALVVNKRPMRAWAPWAFRRIYWS